jgi:hypothetical protein
MWYENDNVSYASHFFETFFFLFPIANTFFTLFDLSLEFRG